MDDLSKLRDELADIDREILRLAARRQELSAEVGRVKRRHGDATRNFAQEKEVLGRARRNADELGLDADFAETLTSMLIRSSLTLQEQDRVAAEGGGDGRRVLIVGGRGKMGSWLARFLGSQGYGVEICDVDGDADGGRTVDRRRWDEGPVDHDLIAVAAPLRVTADILDEMARRPPSGVVFDLGSLKSPLRASLARLREAGGRVASIHPMFGPDTALLSGRHVIFVDAGVPEATETVRQLFQSTMAVQVDMDLEQHDRLIAYVLGLSHALNLAFFTALAESGEAARRLARMTSTTFDTQLEVARRVAEESPQLYFEIQRLNDYGTESLSALLYAVERIRSVVRAGDESGFQEIMEKGREYLRGVGGREG